MNIPIHSKDSSQIRSCQITLSHFQCANSTFFIKRICHMVPRGLEQRNIHHIDLA